MPQIHRVVATTGEYDNYQQREVAAFADKEVAERVARSAQAAADAIIARDVGVKDKGQNPHDLLMVIHDDVMSYHVRSSEVLDQPRADAAEDTSRRGPVTDFFDFSEKQDGWNPIEVELKVGHREPGGERVRLLGGGEEPRRVPVVLRTMEYRGLTFTLRLVGHLAAQRWDEKLRYATPLLRLEDLTPEELAEALATGTTPRATRASDAPCFLWGCERLGQHFCERMLYVSSDPEVSARQLVRIFEGWLLGCRDRRKYRADLDEALKSHGL